MLVKKHLYLLYFLLRNPANVLPIRYIKNDRTPIDSYTVKFLGIKDKIARSFIEDNIRKPTAETATHVSVTPFVPEEVSFQKLI